jgi:hypothetical protein
VAVNAADLQLHWQCCAAPVGSECPRAAAWPRERGRAETHGDARRRGFWGLSDERAHICYKAFGCIIRSSRLATQAHTDAGRSFVTCLTASAFATHPHAHVKARP